MGLSSDLFSGPLGWQAVLGGVLIIAAILMTLKK